MAGLPRRSRRALSYSDRIVISMRSRARPEVDRVQMGLGAKDGDDHERLQKQESELEDAQKSIAEQNRLIQRPEAELAEQRRLIEELLRRTAQAGRAGPP